MEHKGILSTLYGVQRMLTIHLHHAYATLAVLDRSSHTKYLSFSLKASHQLAKVLVHLGQVCQELVNRARIVKVSRKNLVDGDIFHFHGDASFTGNDKSLASHIKPA